MTRKLLQALQNSSINVKPEQAISGLLGLKIGGSTQVMVANRKGYAYVRLRDSLNEVIQARNGVVSNTYDLPVTVIRVGNGWAIKGRDTERYSASWGTESAYLPYHGATHEFDRENNLVGGDPVFLTSEQFRPLLVSPTSVTGSMSLSIHPYIEELSSGTFSYVGNSATIDFSPYVPTDANAIMGLVYANPANGSFGYLFNTGTPFSASITGSSAIDDYIPRLTNSTYNPLVAVRLVSGTTSLGWDNLYDVRQWFGGGSGGGSVSNTILTQDEGVPQGSVTTLNFVGENVDVSVSGTVARVFITGSSGGTLNLTVGDGMTTVSNVDTILFVSGSVVDNTGGSVSINIPPGPLDTLFPITPPIFSDFTWINQGGADVDLSTNGLYMYSGYDTGDDFRILKKAAPTTPYSITALILPQLFLVAGSFASCGVLFRESSTGAIQTVNIGAGILSALEVTKFSDPNTYAGHYLTSLQYQPTGMGIWIRIVDDGTNRRVEVSSDGNSLHTQILHSVSNVDFITADEVGFFVNGSDPTYSAAMTLLSWVED